MDLRSDDQSINELLNETLGKFSKEIDELAEQLKVDTIQIKTEKNKSSKGLFDFSYNDDGLLSSFQQKFGAIKDFELFMEKGLEELWARTEIGLTDIKKHLNVMMVSKLEGIFNEVETKLSSLSLADVPTASYALQEIIATLQKCQTAIVIEMETFLNGSTGAIKK